MPQTPPMAKPNRCAAPAGHRCRREGRGQRQHRIEPDDQHQHRSAAIAVGQAPEHQCAQRPRDEGEEDRRIRHRDVGMEVARRCPSARRPAGR